MTQHIKTHFKEKGANSLIANGALKGKIDSGELLPEEVHFISQVFQGQKRFEDADNPFLKFAEDGQPLNEGIDGRPMNVDREGELSPEPEDVDEDDEEGEMIIDEDPVDHSFHQSQEETSSNVRDRHAKERNNDSNDEETIDP